MTVVLLSEECLVPQIILCERRTSFARQAYSSFRLCRFHTIFILTKGRRLKYALNTPAINRSLQIEFNAEFSTINTCRLCPLL